MSPDIERKMQYDRDRGAERADPFSSGMMGYLGMPSPTFIADALMYKMKQGPMGQPSQQYQSAPAIDLGIVYSLAKMNEMEATLREVRMQNELLKKHNQERSHRLKGEKKKDKERSESDEPKMPPKKNYQPIVPMRLAEGFDPHQFVPDFNKSKGV